MFLVVCGVCLLIGLWWPVKRRVGTDLERSPGPGELRRPDVRGAVPGFWEAAGMMLDAIAAIVIVFFVTVAVAIAGVVAFDLLLKI